MNTNDPIAQSKLAMNVPTTRANATGIAQSDLGLVAFDDGDFTVTDGWVTLKEGSVDYGDSFTTWLQKLLWRIVAGTADVTAVTIDDLIDNYSKFTTTGVASQSYTNWCRWKY